MSNAYTDAELAAYERGRKAGFVAGRIQGISEAITAMTDAARQCAKQAKPPPLRISDLLTALVEGN